MNGKYDQPTAHMLQPVKGWDSMAHLDFVAPIASTVKDALPGTVMHLNSFGELEPGLTAQGMGMYLFYKMWDEDVQPSPLTLDGTRMTAVGMQSFGGYNSEVYLRTWDGDSYNTNGHASNVGAYQFDESTGAGVQAKVKASQSAHTTYPAICGMELSSTEFAAVSGSGATIVYDVNDTLTSPTPVATASTAATAQGTAAQQLAGGFLQKGACYVDPICGIVSKKPVINEHGYKQICFWSTWLPAVAKNVGAIADDATLKVDTITDPDGIALKKLIWTNGAADTFAKCFTTEESTTAKDKSWTVLATSKSEGTAASITADSVYYVRFTETNTGANLNDVVFTLTNNTTEIELGAAASNGISWKRISNYPGTFQVNIDKTHTITTALKLTATYNGLSMVALWLT